MTWDGRVRSFCRDLRLCKELLVSLLALRQSLETALRDHLQEAVAFELATLNLEVDARFTSRGWQVVKIVNIHGFCAAKSELQWPAIGKCKAMEK